MPFVMMPNLLTTAAFIDHADPIMGEYQSCRVDMMYECVTGELLAGAALGYSALKQYAV